MKKFSTLFSAAMLAVSSAGFAQTILSQNFESATIPALPSGWTQNTKAATGWKTNSGIVTSNGGKWTLPEHTIYAIVDDWNHNEDNDSTMLVSPSFSLVGQPNAYVGMDYYYILASYGGNPTEAAYLRISTDGGTVWTTIDTFKGDPTKWQPKYKSLAAYSGQANVKIGIYYSDNKGGASKPLPGMAIDNFRIFTPMANDAMLTAVTPVIGAVETYKLSGATVTLGGTIFNNGSTPITAITVMYQQGANAPVSNTVTGLSIASLTSGDFTCSNAFTFPATTANYPIKMWVVLPSDGDNTNDSGSTSVNTVSYMPSKKMLAEEATGTWCGFCPRGAVYMDSVEHTLPGKFTLVAVHNQDPMVVTAYDSWIGTKIGGYPSVVIDRRDVVDPSELFDVYNNHKDDFGFADLTVTDMGAASFDLSIKVSVKPATDLNGDYRLALALTEDDVQGQGTPWNQHDYFYHTTAYGIMVGAGHDWNNEGTPTSYGSDILAENMRYQFVARMIVPSPTGAIGSLPSTMTAGNTYDYTFNTTVPQPYHREKMKVVAMLIRNSDGQVLNSKDLTMPLGISNVAAGVQQLTVYPNPAKEVTHVNFNLNENAKVSVQVVNPLGQVVSSISEQQYAQGAQQININTANLAAGIYTIKLSTEKGSLTQQLSVVK